MAKNITSDGILKTSCHTDLSVGSPINIWQRYSILKVEDKKLNVFGEQGESTNDDNTTEKALI